MLLFLESFAAIIKCGLLFVLFCLIPMLHIIWFCFLWLYDGLTATESIKVLKSFWLEAIRDCTK